MRPTRNELRKKARAARAWRPGSNTGDARDGRDRAARDISRCVVLSLFWVASMNRAVVSGIIRVFNDAKMRALEEAKKAELIESYFGKPGVVADFARSVREFCGHSGS